ncbi:MAG: GmrSD restriction endonuclease domain-containing protein [Pseudomonadota bacterium]
MKASEANLMEVLEKPRQFRIPIYQRNYAWGEAQCLQLLNDVLAVGTDEQAPTHFLGTIVYVERAQSILVRQEPLMVIDGQQRLTTVTLMLLALYHHLAHGLAADQAEALRRRFLINPNETGEMVYKVVLSDIDRPTLISLIDEVPRPEPYSSRVLANYELFKEWFEANPEQLDAVYLGLSKLEIVAVALERQRDNPQLVFESMNSTGLDLSQADLIRNFVLMGQEPNEQEALYTHYWRAMEDGFGQAAYARHFDSFMRHYLTAVTSDIPNINKVYAAFKQYAEGYDGSIRDLVKEVHTYAKHYCAMALGKESDPKLKQAFKDLRELKVDVAYPLLLEVYHDYNKKQLLSAEELEKIVRMIESYVFRRAVCGIPTNSLNRTFARFTHTLRKDRYLESVKAAFMLLPSYRRFPSNSEFQAALRERDLYHFRNLRYWLRRLENHGRKETVLIDEFTVEHVMPQNPELSREWQEALGQDWHSVQETYLHTLGNLTLTAYNSSYSDKPFREKRDAKDKSNKPIGFAHSPLHLNSDLRYLEAWDQDAILKRATRLSESALSVWQAPSLSDDILEAYRKPSQTDDTAYTLDDHSYLTGGGVRELFDMFSTEVLALDPCVYQDVKKLYVAFKAETNFVDVIPQAKRLLLSLNVSVADLEDPRGLGRDVTGLGRWGNGDIEVPLSSASDLPYVVGLVRQALEQQMDSTQ